MEDDETNDWILCFGETKREPLDVIFDEDQDDWFMLDGVLTPVCRTKH